MSPTLESSNCMKKRSCSALQCHVTCLPELGASGMTRMGAASALLLWLGHFPFSCLQWLSLPLWAGFGPCIVMGPVWGCLGLEMSHTRHLLEMQ